MNDVPGDDIPEQVLHELERYYAPRSVYLSEKFDRSFSHWFSADTQAQAALP